MAYASPTSGKGANDSEHEFKSITKPANIMLSLFILFVCFKFHHNHSM